MNAPKNFQRYTVTSALPYANGPLHIGHLAGAYIPADIYVRYMRSLGKDVVFICGTDEHGAAITIRAKKEGLTPQEVVDKYYAVIGDAFQKFDISFDIFSRTSHQLHHETAQEFFLKFYETGQFLEKETEQLYDESANMFLADRYVTGTCPVCANPNAYGDQCEKCGSSLNPTDLINPKSTISGTAPILKPTKHWYLPLDAFQDRLSKYVLEDHGDWKSNVVGQCKSWLNDGLQPRAITRDLDWGVKVPVEGADGKVLYVWFDAPLGYITATKEWAQEKGVDWTPYWQDSETALIHFIGKDNIVFHCLIFPAILMGHGDYILPENVPANEFLNIRGDKISTSRNWAVWAHEFAAQYPDMTDIMRYVLTATMPETKDNNFTWEEFVSRNNNELVADFGNLVNRVVVFSYKYFEGKVPQRGALLPSDQELLEKIQGFAQNVGTAIEGYRFREALGEMMRIAYAGNKFLADTEPWHLIKTDEGRVATILNLCAHICAVLAVACEPFMPATAAKLRTMLGMGTPPKWSDLQLPELVAGGTSIQKIGLLFTKLDDSFAEYQNAELEARAAQNLAEKAASNPIAPAAEETSFDEFHKMDIRTCTILSAEQVKGTDKLMQLSVDTGLDTRTIVSGVAQHFSPEDLIGKRALCLVNLPPRKFKGITSQGMLLFAEDNQGKMHLVGPNPAVINGATVK